MPAVTIRTHIQFVVTNRQETGQAMDEYHAGRLGVIAAHPAAPRNDS
ncbi:MAG: hypothetical protein ACJ73L_11080 [Actinomycetes bacterium]